MKPKTKIHFEVLKLKEKLPQITEEQITWAQSKLFKYYAYKTKYKAVCFECGYAWQSNTNLIWSITGEECPKCDKTLHLRESKSWSVHEEDYLEIITTCNWFQVIRMFHMDHYCKKGYEASYGCVEVYQSWVSPQGKMVMLGLNTNAMSSWQTGRIIWSWGSMMEIRRESDKYLINDAVSYPKRKYIPQVKRNGFSGKFYKYNKAYFFSLLLRYSSFETLLKTGQTEMLQYFSTQMLTNTSTQGTYIDLYWPQIKICIRNKYFIKDPRMWFDQINLLRYFNKDIFSPKYICPYNLLADHQSLIKKKQDILDAEELEKKAQKIDKENEMYKKLKSKYFGINFTNGVINIIALDHVREFFYEGKALHHCVFQNEYYKKEDTLILSARKGEERLETMEISLRDYALLQIHGNFHKNSAYHKDIVNLLNKNIDQIKEIKKSHKPAKKKVLI